MRLSSQSARLWAAAVRSRADARRTVTVVSMRGELDLGTVPEPRRNARLGRHPLRRPRRFFRNAASSPQA
jgi:hypothetical protein